MFSPPNRGRRGTPLGFLVVLILGGSVGALGAPAKNREASAPAPNKVTATATIPPATVIASVPGAGFAELNGNKVVGGAGALHAVYTENSQVKYVRSTDGVTWSTPVVVAPDGNHPVIAVAGNTVGIAYIHWMGIVQYVSKTGPNAAWTAPKNISTTGHCYEPSMVSYQSRMHLTYTVADPGQPASTVMYVSFTPVITGSLPAASFEYVNPIAMCFGTTDRISLPAIAVTARGPTDQSPQVRIAFFTTSTICGSGQAFSVTVMQRSPHWDIVFSASGAATGNPSPVSMSLAARPGKGDFYMAYSFENNGAGETNFFHQDCWKPSLTWNWDYVRLFNYKAQVDVETMCDNFRLAVSEIGLSFVIFHTTSYRTGTWITSATPVWIEPAWTVVTGRGRNPQAVFFSSHTGPIQGGITHYINVAFDELVISNTLSYFLKHDDRRVNGQVILQPCGSSKTKF